MFGVAADLAAVEDVEHSQLLNSFSAEPVKRDMNQLFAVAFGEAAPGEAGWGRREYRDMAMLTVMTGSEQESFFKRINGVKAAVVPDVGDRAWRKQEHRTTIRRHGDTGADEVLAEVSCEERQRGFVLMFRVPGDSPWVVAGIGWRIEQHDDAVEVAATRRIFFHIQFAGVPVAERFADIQSIFDARCELFDFGEIIPHDRQCFVFDMRAEAFDRDIFWWITAMAERVPAHGPLLFVDLWGLAMQFARSPCRWMARQP